MNIIRILFPKVRIKQLHDSEEEVDIKKIDILCIKNFLNKNQVKALKEKLFENKFNSESLKRINHLVPPESIINKLTISNNVLFNELKIRRKSYVNFSMRIISDYKFHFDHSDWTLILPLKVDNFAEGFCYWDYKIPSFVSPLIQRIFNKLNFNPKLFSNVGIEENTATFLRGRNILHSSPVTPNNKIRAILVIHI
jgi:hypothetical protein